VSQAIQIWLASNSTTTSYTGDGNSGVYIWGAQLSDSASLDAYVPTPGAAPTSTAYYGPRFDYDPITLAPRGLLIEEARTNLTNYSEQFNNVWWSKIAATVSVNTTTAPDGSTTADKLIASATNDAHVAFAQTLIGSGTITISVYAKASEYSWLFLSDTLSTGNGAYFNLSTGTLGLIGASATATITPAGNGWYRCVVTTTAAPGSGIGVYASTGNNILIFTGDGTSGIFVWGAQLEAGAFATSYIPTVASQVTRNADQAALTGSNFSGWYSQPEGTFIAQFDMIGGSATRPSNRVALIARESATASHNIYNGNGEVTGWTVVGGVDQAFLLTGAVSADTATSMAYAYRTNDFVASRNGGTVVTDTTGTLPSPTALGIGSNAANALFLSGHLRSIAYFNNRLSNAQLQALTELPLITSLSLDFINGVYEG
jgi:hypothetical protein